MNKEISYNVLKRSEDKKNVWYSVACGCGSDDHNIEIDFEYDDWNIWVNFYKNLQWSSHFSENFIMRFWRRIKGSLRMLFTGYIEMEESFQINNLEHLNSFIRALEEGREKLLEKDNEL